MERGLWDCVQAPPSPRLSGVPPARNNLTHRNSPEYVIGRSGPHLIYMSMRLLSVIQSGVFMQMRIGRFIHAWPRYILEGRYHWRVHSVKP